MPQRHSYWFIIAACLLLAGSGFLSPPRQSPALLKMGDVVINEIAWAGTAASTADEWLELYNNSFQYINLDGGFITSTQGLNLPLKGVLAPQSYFLIERTDDNTVSDISADMVASFGRGLSNEGDTLFLSFQGQLLDTANVAGGAWSGGKASPNYLSLERRAPTLPDAPDSWGSNNIVIRNGMDAQGQPINGTPKQANSLASAPLPTPTPPPLMLISEVVYDGATVSTEGDEFVELCNPNMSAVNLTGYKVGDAETSGSEGMYLLPNFNVQPNGCAVIAKNGAQYYARYQRLPDFEVITTGNNYTDTATVPNLEKYKAWASGSWALANNGDEMILLDSTDRIMDSVAYRNGAYQTLGLEAEASASYPKSLQRVWPLDSDSMPTDFVITEPNPGQPTQPPPPAPFLPPANLPDGFHAYWGDLHAHTTYSDGSGPAMYALAKARAAGLHFYAITDHDWWLTPLEWARLLTQTQQANVPGQFITLRGIEWTHNTAGHINIFNNDILINRNQFPFSELSDMYTWLANHPEVIAQFNHPDPSYGGTFQDFAYHPSAATVMYMQEIGNDAQKYTTYEGSFIQSNMRGWHVAPTNNSDSHNATWGTNTIGRTGIVARNLTEADLYEAMRARRVFATEDSNLAVILRANGAWMGSVLTTSGALSITVNVIDADNEPFTMSLYDNNLPIATQNNQPEWQTTVMARPGHFFWVKVVQADGNLAYSAPIWVNGQVEPEPLVINEILPAPHDIDWDGDGTADYHDEWIELFNPTAQAVGLGGWQLSDSSGNIYNLPLDMTIPAHGYVVIYYAQSGLSLNNSSDTLRLIHPNGAVIDSVSYDYSAGYDETWCRLPNGSGSWLTECGVSPNAANWQLSDNEPLKLNIFQAKRQAYNAWVKVVGRVTAPSGILGARYFYLQDDSAGILIYLPRNHHYNLALGSRVEVIGQVREFQHEHEIVIGSDGHIKTLKESEPPPPLPIHTSALLEPYEGYLVQLHGQVVAFASYNTLWLDDGTGRAKVYLRASTKIRKPFIERGTIITVVGIVSQHTTSRDDPSADDYQLLPRYQNDLIIPTMPITTTIPTTAWPTMLPETGD